MQCSHAHLETDGGHEPMSNRTISRVEAGTDSRRKFLETRARERKLALDMLLATLPLCRRTPKQIRKILWYRAKPMKFLLQVIQNEIPGSW